MESYLTNTGLVAHVERNQQTEGTPHDTKINQQR